MERVMFLSSALIMSITPTQLVLEQTTWSSSIVSYECECVMTSLAAFISLLLCGSCNVVVVLYLTVLSQENCDVSPSVCVTVLSLCPQCGGKAQSAPKSLPQSPGAGATPALRAGGSRLYTPPDCLHSPHH